MAQVAQLPAVEFSSSGRVRSASRKTNSARRTQKAQPENYESPPVYVSPQDMSRSTVLSSNELRNLTRVAYTQPGNNHYAERDRKVALKKKSESRAGKWDNTLEAQRKNKIRARLVKAERTEAAQKILDEQEQILNDRQRRACIEKANNYCFQQQDPVKEFHSALQYSTVLEGRGEQIEFHRAKLRHEDMVEAMWGAQALEQNNMAIAREEREQIAKRTKSKKVAKMQLEQLRIHQEQLARQKHVNMAQGEKIKNAALEDLREAEALEAEKRTQLKRNNAEYLKANIEQQKLRALRAQAEKREEEKIEEYAREKERMEQKRREFVKAKTDAKQAEADRMRDKQAAHLMRLKQEEMDRLDKESAAREAQGNERVEKENLWKEQQRENIRRSREDQIRIKAQSQERDAYVDAIMAQEWNRRADTMKQHAIDEDRRTFQNNVKHSEFLKGQSAERRVNGRLERIKDLEAARIHQERQAEGDRVYEQYARENIDMFAAQGRSVIPMKLTLRKQHARKKKLVVE